MTAPGNGSAGRTTPVRVKFGPRPFTQTHVCAHCRKDFERGGFWLRIEQRDATVDMPICPECLAGGNLFEAVVPFDRPDPSFPVRFA